MERVALWLAPLLILGFVAGLLQMEGPERVELPAVSMEEEMPEGMELGEEVEEPPLVIVEETEISEPEAAEIAMEIIDTAAVEPEPLIEEMAGQSDAQVVAVSEPVIEVVEETKVEAPKDSVEDSLQIVEAVVESIEEPSISEPVTAEPEEKAEVESESVDSVNTVNQPVSPSLEALYSVERFTGPMPSEVGESIEETVEVVEAMTMPEVVVAVEPEVEVVVEEMAKQPAVDEPEMEMSTPSLYSADRFTVLMDRLEKGESLEGTVVSVAAMPAPVMSEPEVVVEKPVNESSIPPVAVETATSSLYSSDRFTVLMDRLEKGESLEEGAVVSVATVPAPVMSEPEMVVEMPVNEPSIPPVAVETATSSLYSADRFMVLMDQLEKGESLEGVVVPVDAVPVPVMPEPVAVVEERVKAPAAAKISMEMTTPSLYSADRFTVLMERLEKGESLEGAVVAVAAAPAPAVSEPVAVVEKRVEESAAAKAVEGAAPSLYSVDRFAVLMDRLEKGESLEDVVVPAAAPVPAISEPAAVVEKRIEEPAEANAAVGTVSSLYSADRFTVLMDRLEKGESLEGAVESVEVEVAPVPVVVSPGVAMVQVDNQSSSVKEVDASLYSVDRFTTLMDRIESGEGVTVPEQPVAEESVKIEAVESKVTEAVVEPVVVEPKPQVVIEAKETMVEEPPPPRRRMILIGPASSSSEPPSKGIRLVGPKGCSGGC